MAKITIQGLDKLNKRFMKMAADAKDAKTVVNTGFEAAYALYVHEAPMTLKGQPRSTKGMYWDPQGRATNKYLEGPFRELKPELMRIVVEAMQRGATLERGLLLAGLRLQREAQKRVPVDTGNLKGSAFTAVE